MTDLYDETSLPLWSDNPAATDLLGFDDIAAQIAGAIRRERLNPVAVGIHGPWGCGKTTVLGLIAQRLAPQAASEGDSPKQDVLVVQTIPWAYDPNLDVKVSLIGEVMKELQVYAAHEALVPATAKTAIEGLLRKVRWGKAVALAAKTAITLQVPDWSDVEGVFDLEGGPEGAPREDPTMNSFQEDFEKALAAIPTIKRVVVLVDDLDRCLPENVVATLEAIKLFLAVEKMAFVIAFDEAPVVEALRTTRYEKAADSEKMARQYLEKIVQIPVAVPRLGDDEVATYLAVTMLDGQAQQSAVDEIVRNAAARRRSGEPPLLDGHGVVLDGAAAERMELARRLAPLLATPLAGNPRRLKRFINDLWMRYAIARSRGAGLELAPLAKLMVLEQIYPKRFEELVGWASDGTAADRLARVEDGETGEDPAWGLAPIRAWAATAPRVSGLSLKSYLQLAASLRAIDFAPSRLSPELQSVLDELRDREEPIRKAGATRANGLPADQRAEVAVALIESLPSFKGREAELSEGLPSLIKEDDGVGRAVVEAVRALRADSIVPATFIQLDHAKVDSVRAFLTEALTRPEYELACSGLRKRK